MTEAVWLSTAHGRLGAQPAEFEAKGFTIENLGDSIGDVVFRYGIAAASYAKRAGALLLVRPRVLGEKAETVIDLKERAYDYETDGPSLQTDDIAIALPDGVTVDELPAAVNVNASGFPTAARPGWRRTCCTTTASIAWSASATPRRAGGSESRLHRHHGGREKQRGVEVKRVFGCQLNRLCHIGPGSDNRQPTTNLNR